MPGGKKEYKRRTYRAHKKTLANQIRPYKGRCYGDPPSIQLTKPRQIWLSDTITLVDGGGKYTLSDINGILNAQMTAGATTTKRYQVIKINAYSPNEDDIRISITDDNTGIEVSDLGTLSRRAAVSLVYPPAGQSIRKSEDTGDFVSITCSSDTANIDIRTLVSAWCIATNS